MKMKMLKAVMATALLAGAGAASSADFVLVNTDEPGKGFNDATPATPVGGNSGTTVGEQRLIAYGRALQNWGSILKSDVPIVVLGSFSPRSCTATSGVLASAGAWNIEANYPNVPLQNHWYHSALANSIAGTDLYPGADIVDGADIVAFFNSNLGTPGCLEASTWYYGLDNKPGTSQIDFLNVFMHELSHGLGFSNFVNEGSGVVFAGLPDVYMAYTRDNATGKIWDTMTPAEIQAAALRNGQEVWNGGRVTANAPSVLGPLVLFTITSPAGLIGEYEYGTASFGAIPTPANFSGNLVVGLDDGGSGSINDGCTAFTNAAAVAGKIAVVKRGGGCAFAVKTKNAQNAGAIGVVIGNNVAGGAAFGMGGSDATITIPAISVSTALGDALIAAGSATGGLAGSANKLAGADAQGRVRLYAPPTYEPGSSISHYDTAASPNLLMEPAITSTLAASRNVDLTAALFEDIGWKTELSVAGCGSGSNAPATLVSGVYLASPVFACANNAKNKGAFQSCSTQYFNALKQAGVISDAYKGTFSSCTASGK